MDQTSLVRDPLKSLDHLDQTEHNIRDAAKNVFFSGQATKRGGGW